MKISGKLIRNLFVDILKLMRLFTIRIFVKENPFCWLISERGYEAKDNAYFFFRWLVDNHPEYDIKYIISHNSPDLHKFNGLESHLVYRDSRQHYKYLWRAKYLISTHILGFKPSIIYFYELDRKLNFFSRKTKVFLQHGVIWCFQKGLLNNRVNLDLFICGAQIEYNYILDNFGFKSDVVKYTGLCRFDNLHNFNVKKQIVIMPTWRMYLNDSKFITSEYYERFKSLLTDKNMHKLLDDYGYTLVFYPHWEMQKHISLFKNLELTDTIIIADLSYDVQSLLKESALMITDYSSVAFDMLYMRKPVVYYQFDAEIFFQNQYDKPYLNYSDFADVCYECTDVVSAVAALLTNNLSVSLERMDFINRFFPLYDERNSERVYSEIIKK